MTDNTTLADRARGIARSLSYNDDKTQAAAKHLLLEMAHCIDANALRVQVRREGLTMTNQLGKSRRMTFAERLRWRMFKIAPSRV